MNSTVIEGNFLFILTLTYVLMDNFLSLFLCFVYFRLWVKSKGLQLSPEYDHKIKETIQIINIDPLTEA